MNNYDPNSRRREPSRGRGNGDRPSPNDTHPLRNAGGDFNRYSRSRSSYYTQKASENRSSRSRRAPEDSARSRDARAAGGRHGAEQSAVGRYSRDNAAASRRGAAPSQGRGAAPRGAAPGYGRGDASEYSRNSGGYSRSRAGERSRSSQGGRKSGRSMAPTNRELSPEEASNQYSRASRSNYTAQGRKKRGRRRILVGIGAVLAVLLVAGVVFGLGFMNKITANFNKDVDSETIAALADRPINNEPFYMLLMGIDSSKKREENPYFGGAFRSDSILVARIDPGAKKVALISVPRDLRVDLGEYGIQKINAASLMGGAPLAIKTVSKATGLPISHYATINFDGFKEIVDALGGIKVKVPITIDDPAAGGKIKKGTRTLNGKQALILCRSRHAYDQIGAGDYYRAANQRMVIGAIAKKMLKSDPITMMSSAEAVSKCVTTDLSGDDFMGLMVNFMGFDSDSDMYTAQFPTVSQYIGGISYEIKLKDEWKAMRDRMEAGLPPTEGDIIDPTTGTVMASSGKPKDLSATSTNHVGKVNIRNGSGVDGLGSQVGDIIKHMGFSTDIGNANDSFDETLVIYENSDDKEEAKMIVEAIGCGKIKKNKNEFINDGKFMIVIGKDYPTKK